MYDVGRRGTTWNDAVGDLFTYLCEPRLWANIIVEIAYNVKAFDLDIIQNRAIFLKWKREVIAKGLKIISIKMENLVFFDSVSFLPCALRKLREAFGLQTIKSWYPYYFNTEENYDYVDRMLDISYYGVDEMSGADRKEFLAWYVTRNSQLFDKRLVLDAYCQDDITVLRQACRDFRHELLKIENIEVFLESLTIASACNEVLWRTFLKPDTIRLIPTGGYTCNIKYSKKVIMLLIHIELTVGEVIKHARNRR